MDTFALPEHCHSCPSRVVCRCLSITEADVVHAITYHEITTLRDLRRQTGAGEGCTCCHDQLKEYLARHSLTVICGS